MTPKTARQGKAVSNFAVALPEPDSDLAQEVTKNPYSFDFVALTPKCREKELKDAMMAHIEKFLRIVEIESENVVR